MLATKPGIDIAPPPIAQGSTSNARRETKHTRRALYYTPGNAFNFRLPAVPRHVFVAERDRALDRDAPTGFVALDLSAALATRFPATTPMLLASYVVLRPGDALASRFRATGEIYYVITGTGETVNGADRIAWKPGDVFCLPGGGETRHLADSSGAVLFLTTNEPELAFNGSLPPEADAAPIEAVHYPAEEIDAQLASVHARDPDPGASGKAVIFTSAPVQGTRTIIPSIAAAINTLGAGSVQRPHRHNAVAITLCIEGEGVFSTIEGERVDWQRFAAMVTPPAELHSHHNTGPKLMKSLVLQDGGIHYHCRTVGFSFGEHG